MEALGKYVLSVTSAAIIVGIISGISDPKSTSGKLIKMIGGLFIAFTVIQPLTKMDFSILSDFAREHASIGDTAAAYGEEIAQEALCDIIKSQTEAYILDKARLYQTELFVDVTLSQDGIPVPVCVQLWGEISPRVRQEIQTMIEDDLGIPKENQIWI